MKKKNLLTLIQWSAYILIGLWGMASFLILASEDSPNEPMSLGTFCLTKGLALLSGYACYRTGKHLHSKGLLPAWLDKDEEELL